MAPLLRKNQQLEGKLDAWLDLLDAAGLAAVSDVDGEDLSANARARNHLKQIECQSLSPADVAGVLGDAGITPTLTESGLCVWKPPQEEPCIAALDSLSRREQEVAQWLRKGKSAADIGSLLGISPRTAEKHTQHIFSKCGVHTQIELIKKLSHDGV
ncbi:MAG: hypothetical protein JJU20_04340 [Opitutales bacterium]|nr:hypothetical protein [Opitutales bacterium]